MRTTKSRGMLRIAIVTVIVCGSFADGDMLELIRDEDGTHFLVAIQK